MARTLEALLVNKNSVPFPSRHSVLGRKCTHIRSLRHPEIPGNEFVVTEAERTCPLLQQAPPQRPTHYQPSRTTETWRRLLTFRRMSMLSAAFAIDFTPSLSGPSQPKGPPQPGPSSHTPTSCSKDTKLWSSSCLWIPRCPWRKLRAPHWQVLNQSPTAAGQSRTAGIDPWGSGPPSSMTCITFLANLSNQPCSAVVSSREEVPKAYNHISLFVNPSSTQCCDSTENE